MNNCCSCDYDDGNYAAIYDCKERKALKEHKCYECGEVIKKRETYYYYSCLYDGEWSNWKVCKICKAIGDEYCCGSYPPGELRTMLWECKGFDYITNEMSSDSYWEKLESMKENGKP